MDYQYFYIPSANTYAVSTKDIGVLHSIVICTTSSAAITVTDDNGIIAVFPASAGVGTYLFDVAYTGFLTVVTAGTGTLTVCYN